MNSSLNYVSLSNTNTINQYVEFVPNISNTTRGMTQYPMVVFLNMSALLSTHGSLHACLKIM